MFDYALHFRFLQKATEAMFEMGQASVAATLACQKRLYDEMTPEGFRPPEPPAWPAWFGDWNPAMRATAPPQPDLMQSWLAMANACTIFPNWLASQQASGPHAFPMTNVATPWPMHMLMPVPASVQAFWGVTPWSFYQGPMMAMMLSYGVPYAVAAPTARAGTSAMDAADAAYTQWRLVFGSSEGRESLDRTFAVPAPWSSYLH